MSSSCAAACSDDTIISANPWWTTPGWEAEDPHLRRLRARPGIHIVKGPRQVGKSTDLKLIARRHMHERGDRLAVIYLALDLLVAGTPADIDATVRAAKRRTGNRTGQLVLLDEVTAVPGWRTGVKALWDAGVVDRDVVVCTGSSALDLGPEGLPGRRGVGRNHLVLPQAFPSFAKALFPELPDPPGLPVSGLFGAKGQAALDEARLHGPHLREAFERYLTFGGLPAAVSEAGAGQPEPSEEVCDVLADSLSKDVIARGVAEPALFALLSRVVTSLGSKTSYSALGREMDVPLGGRRAGDHRSVKDHLELLAAAYRLLIVENIVALGLHRRYEPESQRLGGFHLPIRLHVWETARREIDFVCGPRADLDVVEVKWRRAVSASEARGLHRTLPSRPAVVVTQDDLRIDDLSALVPAHLFLRLVS